MAQSEVETPKRSCMVCGHPMGPLDRICDVCGSIRRPSKADGKKTPPERHSSCERCGVKIPFGKQNCDECSAYLVEHAKSQRAEQHRTASLLARILRWLKELFVRE